MSPSQLKSYQQLIHSETRLFIQTHGDTGMFALGFQGPESEIQKWHTLFCNFDTRERDEWGDFPKPARLIFLGPSLAYINITQKRLRESLRLYFLTNLPALGDIPSRYYYDEITEIETWERDEAEIERVAQEATEHFVAQEIRKHCFIPEYQRQQVEEFYSAMQHFAGQRVVNS